MVEHFKGIKGDVSRFPAHVIVLSQCNKSDCRGFYSIGLLLWGDDNCLLGKIFLNWRDPEKYQEYGKEDNVKNQMDAEYNGWIAIVVFAFSYHVFDSLHFSAKNWTGLFKNFSHKNNWQSNETEITGASKVQNHLPSNSD